VKKIFAVSAVIVLSCLAAVALVCVLSASASADTVDTFGTGGNQFTIDFVPISGTTNPTNGYGIVDHDYRMGTYEITNDQWDKFAASLGVPVTGVPLSPPLSVAAGAYDTASFWTGSSIPYNNVSWYEAAQFVNWLNTSTGHHAAYKFTGTQGTSDYTLDLWTTEEAAGGTNLYRHKDALYFLPTEDEWVKAAYWNGTALQTYANASPGDLVLGVPDPAKWNYAPSSQPNSGPWAVGSGLTKELNGTYDMMGNAYEWTESPFTAGNYLTTANREPRGGSPLHDETFMDKNQRYLKGAGGLAPYTESADSGFRVASLPTTIITLSNFTAQGQRGEVAIAWATESEIDNAGFNIYRADSEQGEYVKINAALIPAEGSATGGASYAFADTAVKNGKMYYYKLEDIDLNGTATMHGPKSATPRWIFGLFGK